LARVDDASGLEDGLRVGESSGLVANGDVVEFFGLFEIELLEGVFECGAFGEEFLEVGVGFFGSGGHGAGGF